MRASSGVFLRAAAVALVAALLYLPTWQFDYTYLDDNQLILGQAQWLAQPQSLLESFSRSYLPTSHSPYFRPLVSVSLVVNGLVGGTNPMGYHVANGLLHAVASTLVFALSFRVVGKPLPALFGALLFAVSPANTAAVAWIPGRNDSVLVCFALGAVLLLLRDSGRFSHAAQALHLLCFVGALFTKETALCLPLVFLAAQGAVGGREALRGRLLLWIGWLVAIAAYLVARARVITLASGYYTGLWETARRCYFMPLADFGKLVLPVRLQVLSSPEDVLLWPGVVALVIVGLALLLMRRLRTRRLALVAVVVLCPLIMNVPAAQTVILENRLYLPMVGVALFAADWVSRLSFSHRFLAAATMAVLSTALAGLAVAGWRYSLQFENRSRFASAAMEASPRSSVARHLLFRRSYPELGKSRPNRRGP